jgi:hypothetical protein
MSFISCLKEVLRLPTFRARARSFAALLPRALRFLAVGGLGLATNIAVFTIGWMFGVPSLTAGLLALVTASVLTWRLNRAFTFDLTGRPQHEEAMRYALVTAIAQGTSYAGGHRFFSKSKEVVDLWREILPDDFIERPRLSRIFYGGKFYSYPLGALQALTNLGLFTSTACMLSYGYAKLRPVKNARTFHQWVRNQFGEKLFSIFFKTYTEKVWGMSCDEISADWTAQRIKGLDLGVAVSNALVRAVRPSGRAGCSRGAE